MIDTLTEVNFEVPMERGVIQIAVLAPIFILIPGILISIVSQKQGIIILPIALSILVGLGLFLPRYLRDPHVVKIESEGVEFFYRLGKPEFYSWGVIEGFEFGSYPPIMMHFGAIRITHKRYPYIITREATHIAMEYYQQRTGNAPPKWAGPSRGLK